MINKYNYPCSIELIDGVYYVNFFDFDDCFTDADTMQEAFDMADDVLKGVITSYLGNNKTLPKPNYNIEFDSKKFIYIANCSISDEFIKNKSVKKTLSIPKWLNDEALDKGINFSKVLQEALMEKII
ncbi:hypothetical protein [Criibacterium bergeronii]|uniref:Type II toxin-antitoxin system HicB family antitoxin n=1 Tax=Criibacterium bergeronii TaxID=1871336 RepID=A0A371IIY2_9FIRM|nr:hypothetical protein [Criibacterium bergeronii]RDY20423.1 type II toxin-antitoxin system HicB family antitoxin [Criibacterium bergeronii]